MRLKGRREAHNAEVVERALFATRKSLKSLAAKKSFSPFRTIRAITLKLCSHSRPTAIENHPASKLCPALNSDSARRTSTYPSPAISSFGRFRTPVAGVRGIARARPASENVHKMRLSAFQDAAANSRSTLKPDLGTSVRDKRIMLIDLCNRGDEHANADYGRSRKLASEPME